MDPIFLDMSQVPVHRQADTSRLLPPVSIVAEWPSGTFLENLVCLPDTTIAVTVLSEARLDRVFADGSIHPLRQLTRPPTGMVSAGDTLLVCVGEPGSSGHAVWQIDLATGAGDVLVAVPEARFLNGMTWLEDGVLLVADSALGCLFRINVQDRTVTRWLTDERLLQAPGVPQLPGANGVKVFGRFVTVSSTGRALLLRAAIRADGSAGEPELIAESLRADDMAFGRDGVLYLATHLGGSLDALNPDGTRATLAGISEGMAGCTACAFGTAPGLTRRLFVTTTGGIVNPVQGELQPARLACIDLPTEGHPITFLSELGT